MAKTIQVGYGKREQLRKEFGCSLLFVRLALAGDTSTEKKVAIRKRAIEINREEEKLR